MVDHASTGLFCKGLFWEAFALSLVQQLQAIHAICSNLLQTTCVSWSNLGHGSRYMGSALQRTQEDRNPESDTLPADCGHPDLQAHGMS